MLKRAIARNPLLQQRLNALGDVAVPLPENPFLLKARKNLDLPTSCIYLLNSEKYKKFSSKTIKLLLSKHAKKKPFGKMSLGPKKSHAFSNIIANNVKKYSYHTESEDTEFQKPERKLLRLLSSSYKHLQCLDASKLDLQNKSSLYSISKLNRLQYLTMKLTTGKPLPSPRFFQSLKHLQRLTLSIKESPQAHSNSLAELGRVFHNLTLLPSLESYNIDIYTAFSDQSENLVGIVLENLDLPKAKRFAIRVHCSEALNLKIDTFSSLLESIDTLVYKYSGSLPNERVNFEALTPKKLILILRPSHQRESFQNILNACNSLETLSLDQNASSISPSVLKLPQTLKSLTFRFSNLDSITDFPQYFKAWEVLLSSLSNLENLSFIPRNSNTATQQWISQLPQCMSLKSLKQYHLNLEGDSSLQPGGKIEYDSFITEWSRSLCSLDNLEGLSLDITFSLVKSLNCFADALASLSKLKRIRLNLFLHPSQPKETLEFYLPSQNLPSLEHVWLDFSQYVSKNSATKLLDDIANCENLVSFNVSGLSFNEETAISTLKGLPQLKELEIETDTREILTINSKKEIIKHKARFFKRRM